MLPSSLQWITPATFESLERLIAATERIQQAQVRSRHVTATDAAYMQVRDWALVLLGFALGRRGSKLVRVDVEHIERQLSGILVKIPRTKTNRSGEPEYVGVPSFPGHPLCPVKALDVWLAVAKTTAGPVFVTLGRTRKGESRRMCAEDVSRRLEAIAAEAGLEGIWRSHSLRRGVVTSAEAAGVARLRTRTLTGWKSDAMFAVYADHRKKISASPLIDIYAADKT